MGHRPGGRRCVVWSGLLPDRFRRSAGSPPHSLVALSPCRLGVLSSRLKKRDGEAPSTCSLGRGRLRQQQAGRLKKKQNAFLVAVAELLHSLPSLSLGHDERACRRHGPGLRVAGRDAVGCGSSGEGAQPTTMTMTMTRPETAQRPPRLHCAVQSDNVNADNADSADSPPVRTLPRWAAAREAPRCHGDSTAADWLDALPVLSLSLSLSLCVCPVLACLPPPCSALLDN